MWCVISISPLHKLWPSLRLLEYCWQRVRHHSLITGLDAWGLEVIIRPLAILARWLFAALGLDFLGPVIEVVGYLILVLGLEGL